MTTTVVFFSSELTQHYFSITQNDHIYPWKTDLCVRATFKYPLCSQEEVLKSWMLEEIVLTFGWIKTVTSLCLGSALKSVLTHSPPISLIHGDTWGTLFWSPVQKLPTDSRIQEIRLMNGFIFTGKLKTIIPICIPGILECCGLPFFQLFEGFPLPASPERII